MRICLDIRYTTKSGASTFIEGFVQQLSGMSHDHTIDVVSHPSCPGRRGFRVDVPFRNRWLEFQWSQTMLPRHLKHRNYDVYHSLKHVGPMRCPVRSVYRVPAVGQFVGCYPQRFADQAYWGHAARYAYRRADLLIAVSNYVRQGLIEYLDVPETRIVTVPNGVDDRFRPLTFAASDLRRLAGMGIDRPFMLSVANLVPVKNLSTLLRAIQMLGRDDLQLVLAGSCRTVHADRLRNLATELGVSDRVIFAGSRPFDDLIVLYNQAELLVHPSLHEGFSSAILEAMACGLPIVAANTTSIPETTGDAALYHSPVDADELKDVLSRVLDDSVLRSELSCNALRRVKRFTWSRCLTQTLAAYGKLN